MHVKCGKIVQRFDLNLYQNPSFAENIALISIQYLSIELYVNKSRNNSPTTRIYWLARHIAYGHVSQYSVGSIAGNQDKHFCNCEMGDRITCPSVGGIVDNWSPSRRALQHRDKISAMLAEQWTLNGHITRNPPM